jgi:hypothetical protein
MEFIILAINTLIAILTIFEQHFKKLRYNCQYRISIHTQYEFILINDAIQKLNSIRVCLMMTQVEGQNM